MSSNAFRMFLAVLLVAALALATVVTRYEYNSHIRYDRWTGTVDVPLEQQVAKEKQVAKENRFLK